MFDRTRDRAAFKATSHLSRLACECLEDRSVPAVLGGVELGNLTDYLFFFANGSVDANWQGASKGFAGDVVVNGQLARERTSGGVPFAGTIFTNDSTLGAWQNIVDQNPWQAFASTGQTALIDDLSDSLSSAMSQIDTLPVTAGFESRSASSLNGLNTQDGVSQTYVINVTSGFQVSSKINITGDANDVFILRWDTNANPADGYQGQVKFQSGGAIVPLGGLTPANFIHTAGDINASGGGGNPASPYPQGPRLDNGAGDLVARGKDFSGGGFFTGYWLTTGNPSSGATSSLSNAVFVGGWYTTTTKFSMTSGTSGVHISPPPSESLGSISGHVYLDSNQDGLIDTTNGDFGIDGIVISLLGADGNVIVTTTTHDGGYYEFTNLAAGTYGLRETQVRQFRDGYDYLGSLGGILGNDEFSQIDVDGAKAGVGYDFTEQPID